MLRELNHEETEQVVGGLRVVIEEELPPNWYEWPRRPGLPIPKVPPQKPVPAAEPGNLGHTLPVESPLEQ